MIEVRRIDDVVKDKRMEEKEKAKKELIKDTRDVLEGIFPKKEKKVEKKKFSLIKWFGILSVLLILVTIILGCVWLIKFFIGSIF